MEKNKIKFKKSDLAGIADQERKIFSDFQEGVEAISIMKTVLKDSEEIELCPIYHFLKDTPQQ